MRLVIGVCLVLATAAACSRELAPVTMESPAGTCSMGAPDEQARLGLTAYDLQNVQPTDPRHEHGVAMVLTCFVGGADDSSPEDNLVIVLPYLPEGLKSGSYRIVDPDLEAAAPDSIPLEHRAYASARRAAAGDLDLTARAGVIELLESENWVLTGAFQFVLTEQGAGHPNGGAPYLILAGSFEAPPSPSLRPFLP